MIMMIFVMIAKIIGGHQWTTLLKDVEKDKNVTMLMIMTMIMLMIMLMIMMMLTMNANIIGDHTEAQRRRESQAKLDI